MDLDSRLLWVVAIVVVAGLALGLAGFLDDVARIVVRLLLRRFIRDLLF